MKINLKNKNTPVRDIEQVKPLNDIPTLHRTKTKKKKHGVVFESVYKHYL